MYFKKDQLDNKTIFEKLKKDQLDNKTIFEKLKMILKVSTKEDNVEDAVQLYVLYMFLLVKCSSNRRYLSNTKEIRGQNYVKEKLEDATKH